MILSQDQTPDVLSSWLDDASQVLHV